MRNFVRLEIVKKRLMSDYIFLTINGICQGVQLLCNDSVNKSYV